MAAKPYDFVDWATVKSILGLNDAQQTLVELLIHSASLRANSISRRHLKAIDKEELFDGQSLLLLSEYPVNTLTDIRIDPLRDFGTASIIDPKNYVVYKPEGIVKILYTVVPRLPLCIKATYNAGFSDVPEDLVQAVIEVVKVNMGRIQGNILGIKTQSIDGSISTSYELEIPITAKRVFESYRSVR